MTDPKPIRLLVVPISVGLAVFLAAAALWMSPNDPERTGDPRGGSGQAERPLTGFDKAKQIWSRCLSRESWVFGRKPVNEVLGRALPRTLRVNVPGLLLGWSVGFLLGSWAGSCRHRLIRQSLITTFFLAVIAPHPIWVCCCRMALIETGLFRLSDGGFVPASITVAILTIPLIALNQAILVNKAVRRPEVRFAEALRLPYFLRWRLILWHTRSYWWSELALLGVAFCEGGMLVERCYCVKGIGDSMYLACTKGDPCLVLALIGATAMLVNFGVVGTTLFITTNNGKEDRR